MRSILGSHLALHFDTLVAAQIQSSEDVESVRSCRCSLSREVFLVEVTVTLLLETSFCNARHFQAKKKNLPVSRRVEIQTLFLKFLMG